MAAALAIATATAVNGQESPDADPPDAKSPYTWTRPDVGTFTSGDFPPFVGYTNVAVLPSGAILVAVNSTAWLSQDGTEWTKVDLPAPYISGAASDEDGIVVAGWSRRGTQTWSSADGTKWSRRAVPGRDAQVTGISETTVGPVLTGQSGPVRRPRPTIWTQSEDGSWKSTIVGPGYYVRQAAVSPEGVWLAHGQEGKTSGPKRARRTTYEPKMWRSMDGEEWTVSRLPGGKPPMSLVAGPGGFVASTVGDGSLAEVWHSTDGEAWEQVFAPDLYLGALIATDEEFVALLSGAEQGSGAIATSPDGRDWTMASEPMLDGVGGGSAAVADDGRIVTARPFGEFGPNSEWQMYTWIGEPVATP
jgi:hypothetical protein